MYTIAGQKRPRASESDEHCQGESSPGLVILYDDADIHEALAVP